MLDLNKLLASIEKHWSIKPDVYVINYTDDKIISSGLNIHELRTKKIIPLSNARNKLIKEFNLIGNTRYSHFLFLDDDCWFAEPFDSSKLRKNNSYVGLARSPSGILLHSTSLREFTCAISINLIVSTNHLTYFDEKLGLGSPIAAGEDWDYFLNLSQNNKFAFTTDYVVTHESFREKISRLTYPALNKKAESEALAIKYIKAKYNVNLSIFLVRAVLKAFFPFLGARFMYKNLCFLYHYVS